MLDTDPVTFKSDWILKYNHRKIENKSDKGENAQNSLHIDRDTLQFLRNRLSLSQPFSCPKISFIFYEEPSVAEVGLQAAETEKRN